MIISIEDFEVNKSEIEKVKSIIDELAESLVEVAHNPQMTVTISCKLCEPMNEEDIT